MDLLSWVGIRRLGFERRGGQFGLLRRKSLSFNLFHLYFVYKTEGVLGNHLLLHRSNIRIYNILWKLLGFLHFCFLHILNLEDVHLLLHLLSLISLLGLLHLLKLLNWGRRIRFYCRLNYISPVERLPILVSSFLLELW